MCAHRVVSSKKCWARCAMTGRMLSESYSVNALCIARILRSCWIFRIIFAVVILKYFWSSRRVFILQKLKKKNRPKWVLNDSQGFAKFSDCKIPPQAFVYFAYLHETAPRIHSADLFLSPFFTVSLFSTSCSLSFWFDIIFSLFGALVVLWFW